MKQAVKFLTMILYIATIAITGCTTVVEEGYYSPYYAPGPYYYGPYYGPGYGYGYYGPYHHHGGGHGGYHH